MSPSWNYNSNLDYGNRDLDYVEFHELGSRHLWTVKSLDEYIVGRLHSKYDLFKLWCCMTCDNLTLGDITIPELLSFWDRNLIGPNNPYVGFWAAMNPEDPRVKEVLTRIQRSIIHTQAVIIG